MSIRMLTVAVLLAVGWLWPQPARACSCGTPDPGASFEKADLVFRGQVVGWEGEHVQFRVEGYYKGSGPSEVYVHPGPGLCRREFVVDGTYVVFAPSSLYDGLCSMTFEIDADGGTPFRRTPEEAVDVMKEAGAGGLTKPEPGPPLKPSAEPEEELGLPLPPELAEPQAPAEPEAPARPAPAAEPVSRPEAERKAAFGCLSSVHPHPVGGGLLVVALGFWVRRRD